MRAALDGIAAATAGKTLEDFRSDWLLRHGVERGIEIISEAARHVPDDLTALAPVRHPPATILSLAASYGLENTACTMQSAQP
ncbi:DUF86 domain-containing protein [Mesorhizobium sp. MSK_1335]|uniref:DUF86 domain-containing protein n=1 Tax=Mesorhizobium montanum TaxID=3072323 RepID=A0ABU4ZN19_9HYPH|nr:HepT-like ribonuclease domain-containing protein [Mesorhizobium sp. MSK_1335]MDX8525714.1 DUF86 domain-containing protein [Mesorhizobium sp. MSK_1335]